MSYCRFSSDDWDCQLYIYESMEGFVIHVAGRKPSEEAVALKPKRSPEKSYNLSTEEGRNNYIEHYRAMSEWHRDVDLVPIGLPHDGETFTADTLEELLEKVQHLGSLGYKYPDYLEEIIKEEINDQSKTETE